MRRYLLYTVLMVLAACKSSDEMAPPTAKFPFAPLNKSTNSDTFNLSFGKLLNDYYSLKDNFIAQKDSSSINASARSLLVSSDSLALGELKADTNLIATAKTYTLGISAELQGLLGETTLEAKRKAFQMVSDQLYDLIRTVQYDQAVIYHVYCRTAFSDQGANWLNNSPEIRNPYNPEKKIDCGEIRDSIDFRPKR